MTFIVISFLNYFKQKLAKIAIWQFLDYSLLYVLRMWKQKYIKSLQNKFIQEQTTLSCLNVKILVWLMLTSL